MRGRQSCVPRKIKEVLYNADDSSNIAIKNRLVEVMMHFEAEPATEHSVVIHIGKTLNFGNAEDFERLCRDTMGRGYRNFILDFSETGILDSTGLGAVFTLYRQVPSDGKVVFASPSQVVQVVMQITRIYRTFPYYPSVQAACRALA